MGTETGNPNVFYAPDPAALTREALNFSLRICPTWWVCGKNGVVVVAIEPVCQHIVYKPERARQVLRAIASPNLQIILDPVNLLDGSNAANQKDVVKNAIDILGEDVAVIHVKDFTVKDGKVISMAAGQGIMDYSDLIHFMKRISLTSMRRWRIPCRRTRWQPESLWRGCGMRRRPKT